MYLCATKNLGGQNSDTYDQSIGSIETKYIKLNTETQNFFLITFDFVIHFKRKFFFPSISYYFHIPKLFLIFFPHNGKNRNRRKSNLLP